MTKRNHRFLDWKASLPEGALEYCPWCCDAVPKVRFWNFKRNRPSQVCADCLKARASAKRVKKGKSALVSYKDYLRSPDWARKRAEYWEKGAYRECYVCGDLWENFTGKELHHRTYKRLGAEQLDDLVPVCPEHHALITSAWAKERKKKRKERRTLWEVTEDVRTVYRSHQLGEVG